MRRIIPVIIFAGAVALIVLLGVLGNKSGPRSVESQQDVAAKKILAQIESYDLENNYPEGASEVVSINNEIVGYLYGGAANNDKISSIINIQRKLFGAELTEINPEDVQLSGVIQEIHNYKEKDYRLIQFKSFPPEYYENNIDNCMVKVIQYTNTAENNYLYYYLTKDDFGLWKIMGWELSDKVFSEAGAIINE